jgi:hypothetical protein
MEKRCAICGRKAARLRRGRWQRRVGRTWVEVGMIRVCDACDKYWPKGWAKLSTNE